MLGNRETTQIQCKGQRKNKVKVFFLVLFWHFYDISEDNCRHPFSCNGILALAADNANPKESFYVHYFMIHYFDERFPEKAKENEQNLTKEKYSHEC